MDKWDTCAFPVDPERLHGRMCYGGLDFSSTTDITAFVLVLPPAYEGGQSPTSTRGHPERLRRRVPGEVQSALTGDNEDGKYEVLPFFWLSEDSIDLRVRRDHVPYDTWAQQGLGFMVVPFGQRYKDMSPPTKELLKLTLEGKLAHGGHPVLRWMVDNVTIRSDPAGNIKADKEKSTEKIDGAIATIMALDRAIRHEGDSASVYDERGLLFI